MILEPIKKKRSAEDDSFVGIRVGVLLLIGLLLFGVLAFRLWYLQILSGDDFVSDSMSNRLRTVMVEAPRGNIYDRDGEVLVENRAGLSVGMLPMDMPDPEEEPAAFYAEMTALSSLLDKPLADLLADYKRAQSDPYVTYVIEEDVAEETVVAYLEERGEQFPGVEVEKTYLREYPHGALAAHVLGYVGEVSQADLDQMEFSTLMGGSHIGKDGIERTYDSYLRGKDGWKTVEVTAAGKPIEFIDVNPAETGYNLVLTIDSQLQQAAEEAILEGLQRAWADGFTKASAGAVVALDPRTGEVLALASYPDYDPSVWVGGIDQATYSSLTAPEAGNPFFDRAVNGLYPAASTFKPFVASVALNAGLTTRNTIFSCDGRYELQTSAWTQVWKCWKSDGHRDVNLVAALAQSCDFYFYTLGHKLYNEETAVLQDGLRLYGFGRTTGIDLPNETEGSRVPDKTWARERGEEWKTGDEINLAIGQGDLLVTPLQEAVALAAIVNGGTVWVPRLVRQITDSSGSIINTPESEKRGELGFSQQILDIVKEGMVLVTSDPSGTAFDAFWGFPVLVGGKTGTAQVPPKDDYALFMGYAPAGQDKVPEIVVVAVIEQGGHGSSVAAPVVRRVMEEYFGIEPSDTGYVSPTE
jgi:penicillin-binding protein 2